MSSRWISTSLSRPSTPFMALTRACAALTSEDLPMPRAPHNSALLAGRPVAKRSVFSISMSRIRSMPCSRPMSTRLTFGTGARRPSGCQTKASARFSESALSNLGEAAAMPAAIASSARAIRSSIAGALAARGRFAAAALRAGAGRFGEGLATRRGAVLAGFLDILVLPVGAPITSPAARRKRFKCEANQRRATLQLGPRWL